MNDKNISAIPVFPLRIAHANLKHLNLLGADFDKEINDILDAIPETRKLETATGEYSTTLRQYQDVMTLESVKNFNKYMKTFMKEAWATIGYEECGIAIERSWVNRFTKGSQLRNHAHGSTEMVMTYYHKMPEGSASITFFNPFDNYTGMAPFKEPLFRFTPKEGDILAWPGFLWHEVDEQAVDSERIAISMHVHQGSHMLVNRWRRIN